MKLETVRLELVSGVCAILLLIVAIAGFVLFGMTEVADSQDAIEFLPGIDKDKGLVASSTWLFVLAPLLLLGTVPGFFLALRQAGDVLWIAAIASVVGVVLLILSASIELAVIYELATPYVEGGPETGADLLVLGDTLSRLTFLARSLGDVIFSGIGSLIFSLAMLQTGFASKWLGWLGLVGAVGHWFVPLSQVAEVFELLFLIGELAFFIWVAIVGVILLRKSISPDPAL